MHVKTVIIGCGISGLSAAHFLSKKRKDFLVLESSQQIGGIIQTKKNDNFICENGPNTVLLNNEAIIEIVSDCGLLGELQYPSNKSNENRFLIRKNKLILIPRNLSSFITSKVLSTRAKFRIIGEFFIKKHHKNTTVYEFISKRFGKEFHDKLIEPFLTGIYAGNTKKMSAKHSLKLLWSLEQEYGSILKGFLKRKNNNIKAFNFHGGLQTLIEKIAIPLAKNIKLGYKVDKVLKKNDGYEIVSDLGNITCDEIICSAPAYSLKKIIWDMELVNELNKVVYNPIDVFHFGVLKNDINNNINGFGVLAKPSDKKSFLGVLFSSQIFDFVSSKDTDLFTVLVGGARQKELCSLPIDELEKIILKEFENLIKLRGNIVFKNHFRWKNGIPEYNLSQELLIKKIKFFEKNNPNFHIIGNYFNGLSVSDCIKNAKNITTPL